MSAAAPPTVQRLAPEPGPVAVPTLLRDLAEAPDGRPFDADRQALCADLSARLLDHPAARRFPELVALGWWLRPAEVTRLARAFAALEDERSVLCPRGLALHLPPANVDTLSVHSWALSLLVGNRNLVRLSSRRSPVSDAVSEVLSAALAAAAPALRAGNQLVSYPHDAAVTAALCAGIDARVVWGGDATVAALRAVPMPATAVDLSFGDRWSLAVARAGAWRDLSEEARDQLAQRLFNDAYWFDQQACASPRMLAWVGAGGHECGRELFTRVAAHARARGWQPDAATSLQKLEFAARAVLDAEVRALFRPDPAVTVIELHHARGLSRAHEGGGLFYQVELPDLEALLPLVQRRDQTLVAFGFSDPELRALARSLGGRGIDRIVPFGQALAFHRYWDGLDLLQALSRRVGVQTDPGLP
ncbi:gamma-glutamyl phosphate reductase [Myxococcota bacterium]|nr:gamma-glutamyl phosphate reductase [Myxococcota bacterium]